MPSKFSLFAQQTKDLETKAKTESNRGQQTDSIPAKDKNPDDLEVK
ncbi:MAG: hypothetical protein AWM53_01285 [Candidatus Dichloromethanomonas elyunquensis]|nr:MAG: hypothetical protein AWM53_01285 [Candidatus Dichloromethanomonas elyunquensis]